MQDDVVRRAHRTLSPHAMHTHRCRQTDGALCLEFVANPLLRKPPLVKCGFGRVRHRAACVHPRAARGKKARATSTRTATLQSPRFFLDMAQRENLTSRLHCWAPILKRHHCGTDMNQKLNDREKHCAREHFP